MEARHTEDGGLGGERPETDVEEPAEQPDAFVSPTVDFLLLFALTLLFVFPLLVLL